MDNITVIMIVFEGMENFVKARLERMNSKSEGNKGQCEALFDEKSKHIFRTAPDRTSLKLNGKQY